MTTSLPESTPAAPEVSLDPAGGPLRMLVNDEGKAALHFIDREKPERSWQFRGPGRDLQLIGAHRVLRSAPTGYAELDLYQGGTAFREIAIEGLPGGIESARRLTNGNTVVAGNGPGSVFVWEIDGETGRPLPDRQRSFAGIDKVRLIRLTAEGTILFCSETQGRSVVHELRWGSGLATLFEVPKSTPADSMVKAVRIAPDVITVSTGYAASLLRVDTRRQQVLQTVGGRGQPKPPGATRPLSPFFFSGYQMFEDGAFLVANWQGHNQECNGQGYQILRYDRAGRLTWAFDQTRFPATSSLNNLLVLDGLDTARLHDEPRGVLEPVSPGPPTG